MMFWTRDTTNSYRLSPAETLPQFAGQYPDNLKSVKTTHLNEPIKLLISRISDEWPPIHIQESILEGSYRLASLHSFTELLEHNLGLVINIQMNAKPINSILLRKLDQLQVALKEENFQWAVYERFLNGGEGFQISDGLKASRQQACKLRKYLNMYLSAGKTARKHAIFIGYTLRAPLAELVKLERKSMVELKSFAVRGLGNGQISDVDPNLEGPNYIIIEDAVHRVCAPTDGEAYPIIFWTKDDQSDITPTAEKIFGSIVYNSSKLFPNETDFDLEELHELPQIELNILQYLTVRNSTVNRQRLRTEGKMAKGPGTHAVFGKPYTCRVGPSLADSDEMPDRFEFGEIEPVLDAQNHAFLKGFIPELASKFVDPAKHGHLINVLGSPRLSTFVAFAYSASPHLDADATPSSGRVLHRPPELNRNTYNFLYMSHKLLVELETDTRWVWNAAEDYHGTTSSDFTKNTPDMTMGFIKRNLMSEQWTKVSVIPKSVLLASISNHSM